MHKVVAFLVALMFLPLAGAQTQVLQDDPDDVQSSAMGQAPIPAGTTPGPFDLLALNVDEDADLFTFQVFVGTLEGEAQDAMDTGYIFVDFSHADQAYRLHVTRDAGQGSVFYYARFTEFDSGRQSYVYRENLDVETDADAARIDVKVPREWLLDGNGTAPTAGRELSLFKAFTRGGTDFFGPSFVQMTDSMPDSGFGEIPYKVVFGLQQSGDARLSSDQPVRASNGEKGTFVYYVQGRNLGDESDRFTLSTKEVPKEWDVTLPAPSIRIKANKTVQFPVIVSTPFNHQHGAFENFILEMQNERDSNDVGRIQLGIRYLEVPQPAGHHDRLYIHTRPADEPSFEFLLEPLMGGRPVAFMNTLEEDGAPEELRAPPRETRGMLACCGSNRYTWEVYLEPGLQLGLDFDLNDTGEIQLEFESDFASSDLALQGSVVHVIGEPDGRGGLYRTTETILADIVATSPKSVDGRTSYDSIIQPKKAADLIPYSEHAALRLDLTLTSDGQTNLGLTEGMVPHLVAGTLRLPLHEYRDPVEDVFNALAGLDFRHTDRSEKYINPGEVVLFNLTLINDGAVDDDFQLRVNGTNVAWARILGDENVFVPTGQSRQVVIAVSAPVDAPDGDVVDLIVTAASATEPTVQGNIRVVAIVDTILDHPDESHLVRDIDKLLSSEKKSPGFELLALMAILAGIAAVLPRRQKPE